MKIGTVPGFDMFMIPDVRARVCAGRCMELLASVVDTTYIVLVRSGQTGLVYGFLINVFPGGLPGLLFVKRRLEW